MCPSALTEKESPFFPGYYGRTPAEINQRYILLPDRTWMYCVYKLGRKTQQENFRVLIKPRPIQHYLHCVTFVLHQNNTSSNR